VVGQPATLLTNLGPAPTLRFGAGRREGPLTMPQLAAMIQQLRVARQGAPWTEKLTSGGVRQEWTPAH